MYHSISSKKNNFSVSVKNFKKQMKLMSDLNFSTINLNEVNNKTKNKKNFIITFDDGYEDVYLNALPILKEFKFTSICYFVTDLIGQYNDWDYGKKNYQKIKLMDIKQIQSWKDHGMQIGAHTSNHKNLTKINYEDKKKEIIDPINFFKKNLLLKINDFSYPFGCFDDDSINIIKNYYKTAVTTKRSRYKENKFNNFILPRVPINNSTSILKFLLKIFTPYEDIKF